MVCAPSLGDCDHWDNSPWLEYFLRGPNYNEGVTLLSQEGLLNRLFPVTCFLSLEKE